MKNKQTLKMFQSAMLNRLKNIFKLWLETDFFSPHHTQNSSFKISINMSSIQSRYPCELVTHAFSKLVSRFKQQHSQKLFSILWTSNAFQSSAKPAQICILAGRSDLPGSGFWPDTCGMLQQVQDKKFPEVAGTFLLYLCTQTNILI